MVRDASNIASAKLHQPAIPMNFDQQTPPPAKSSTRKWLIGGCGCLALIGVIAAAAIIWMSYAGAGLFSDFQKMATEMEAAMKSPEVEEAFGTPLEVLGQSQTTSKVDGASVIVISQELKGPKGKGKMELVMEQKNSVMPRITSARIITPDGKEIPLRLDGPRGSSPTPETAPGPEAAPAPEVDTE